MQIKALMLDVDGVLVNGRPEDGRHWQTSIERDLGVSADTLHDTFFGPHWDHIVVGRTGLMEHVGTVLREIAPQVDPRAFVAYWFHNDSRLAESLLPELSLVRSAGIRVYLATNQEHLRAAFLMDTLRLADHVDGIFYSARLGARKPEREFFDRVREEVGLGGEEILLVDDSRSNTDAAREAGWQAIHWTKDTSPTVLRSLYE